MPPEPSTRAGVDGSGLPGMVSPMLATPGAPPSGPGWAVEFKWDGIRAVLAAGSAEHGGGTAVRVWSRNGNDVTASYPELATGAEGWGARGPLLLDGEIVALDQAGRPSFARLAERMHVRRPSPELVARIPVQLYAFDLLHHHGYSLLGEGYDERRAHLDALGLGEIARVAVPPSVDLTPAQGLAVAREHGLEGIVAKRRRSRYEPGRRSPAWVKTALVTTQEVVIGGWTPGKGRRSGLIGALLLGAHDQAGRLRYLGNVGTGFTDANLRQLAAELAPLAQTVSGFDEPVLPVEARAARWVRPVLVGEVVYRTLTPELRLRHAAWRGLRPDRDPAEVVLAQT